MSSDDGILPTDLPEGMRSPPAIAAGTVTISIREWSALIHLARAVKRSGYAEFDVHVRAVREAMSAFRREGVIDTASGG